MSASVLKRLSRAGPDLRNELRNISIRKKMMGNRRQRNFGELWAAFENQSTFHGICHAAAAPSKRWRIMWYTAFGLCFAALVYQTANLISRYLKFEKTVDVDLKFEKAPFPSVTICNLNPYKASGVARVESVRETMNAYATAIGGKPIAKAEDVEAAAAAAARTKRQAEKSRDEREAERERREREAHTDANGTVIRRYHPVYAPCVCDINAMSGMRRKGGCLPAHRGTIFGNFAGSINPSSFRPSKCMCDFDTWSKTLWPCFPYNTWKERLCTECTINLGHCPMIFRPAQTSINAVLTSPSSQEQDWYDIEQMAEVCLCHDEYNHCISNERGYIPEISADGDLSTFDPTAIVFTSSTTTTTTAAPEVKEALGFEELKDEIAIANQGRENLVFAVSSLPYERRIDLSNSLEEFILKCSFNQKDCHFERDFKLYHDETYGNCFIFNWNRSSQIVANRAGANYGLRLLVYVNVSEYLPTSPSVGVRITVHDKWHVPFPDAFGYSAPTGFLTSFGVRMKQFERIPAPYGRCQEGGEDSPDYIYHGFNYSVEGCHRSCTQKEIIATCGCADPSYPIPNHTTYCSVKDPVARNCIKNTTVYLGEQIAQGKLENCVCHQPCRETAYETTFSTSRWPSGTTKVMECTADDDLCLERYRQNAAMVQIFYEELNYETMTESPAYSMVSAFADFGGLTGLWIGASVVSCLELIVLIYFMSKTWYGKKKKSSAMIPPQWYTGNATDRKPSMYVRPTVTVKEPSPPILTPKISKIEETPPKEEELTEDEPEMALITPTVTEQSPPPLRKATRYVPPDVEIGCQCEINENGTIEYLNVFCPEHGYLVRRNTQDFSAMGGPKDGFLRKKSLTFGDKVDDIEEEEEEDEEDEDDEGEDETTHSSKTGPSSSKHHP